jgi:hypothetical protein
MAGAVAGVSGIWDTLSSKITGHFQQIEDLGNRAEKIMNAADAFGIGVQSFQGITAAAQLAGVEVETLEKGFKELANTIVEGAMKEPEALKKFANLGLDPTALSKMSPDKAFNAVAKSIERLATPMERVKAASDIFGARAGFKLLPVLTGDFAKLSKEMEGLAKTADQFKRFDDAGDSVTKFGMAWQALKDSSAEAGLGLSQKAITALTDSVKELNDAIFVANADLGPNGGFFDFLDRLADLTASGDGRATEIANVMRNIKKQEEEFRKARSGGISSIDKALQDKQEKELKKQQDEYQKHTDALEKTLESAGRRLISQSPFELLAQQIAGLDLLMAKGAVTAEQNFKGVGRAYEELTAATAEKPMNAIPSPEAMLAGSNEAVRASLQNRAAALDAITTRAGTSGDAGKRDEALIRIGQEQAGYLKKLVEKQPVMVDAR